MCPPGALSTFLHPALLPRRLAFERGMDGFLCSLSSDWAQVEELAGDGGEEKRNGRVFISLFSPCLAIGWCPSTENHGWLPSQL